MLSFNATFLQQFACPLCKDLLFGGFAMVVKPKNPPKEGE